MKTRIIAAIIIGGVASLLTVSSLDTTPFILCSEGYVQDGQECVRIQCSENFIIYENNCIPVNSENRFTFDASIYFKSVDGKITELCERDFEQVPEVETCQDTKFYTIENNEIKFYLPENYSRSYDGREPVIYPTVEEIEESVRQEIQDLLTNTDVQYYSINLNHKTGIIEIFISDESYDSQVREIISKYELEAEFDISYVNYTDGIILDDFK